MKTENTIRLNRSLYPIAAFYGMGVWVRNFMFNKGLLPSEQYPVPVISIGNLSVGGTGKTPHTEYIINLLKENYKVAVLSRGYKRKTKGFLLATTDSSSKTIGDEPFQIKLKFPDIIVAVDENRRRGIHRLLELPADECPQVILLDDAYQHRYVTPSLSVLLTDYHRLFCDDQLLPVGRLRESKQSALRADIVVVTKCDPDLKPIDYRIVEENLDLWAQQQLYFSRIIYGEIKPVFPETFIFLPYTNIPPGTEIIALAGIAKPELFIEEIKRYSDKIQTFIFPDHHNYNKKDINKIDDTFRSSSNTIILTTEKDAARLKDNKYIPEEWKNRFYYLPITVDVTTKQYEPFDEVILQHVSSFKRNRI